MNLSKNFTLEELTHSTTAKRKGINNTPTKEEIDNLKKLCETILQPIRDKYKKPIRITSGYRSAKLNKVVGGSSTSQHTRGEAADIDMGINENRILYELIKIMVKNKEIEVGQCIDEHSFDWIHISLPNTKHHNEFISLC